MKVTLPRTKIFRYGAAFAAVALALFITVSFDFLIERSSLALLFAAVIVVAWYGGWGPGPIVPWAFCHWRGIFHNTAALEIGNVVGCSLSALYICPLDAFDHLAVCSNSTARTIPKWRVRRAIEPFSSMPQMAS